MEENELYPVVYNLCEWHETDCDEIFVNCYHSREDLNCEGGVYIAEGTWVFPDGHFEHW